MSTFIVLVGVGYAFLAFAAIMEHTERGRRITRRLLISFLGEPEPPQPIYRQCCVAARAGRSEAGYWHHRVQDHGEGAA